MLPISRRVFGGTHLHMLDAAAVTAAVTTETRTAPKCTAVALACLESEGEGFCVTRARGRRRAPP